MSEPVWVKILDRNHTPLVLHLMGIGQERQYQKACFGWDYEIRRLRKRGTAYIIDMNEVRPMFPLVASRMASDPGFPTWFIDRCYQQCDGLVEHARRISRVSLVTRDDVRREWEALMEDILCVLPLLSGFYAFEHSAQDMLRESLKNRGLADTEAAAAMVALIVPEKDNYIAEEMQDLWAIGARASQDESLCRALSQDTQPDPQIIADVAPDIYAMILSHCDKYGWLKSSYTFGPPFGPKDVIGRLTSVLARGPEVLIRKRAQDREAELALCLETEGRLQLTEKETQLLSALRRGLHLHTYKMDCVFLAYSIARPLVGRVAEELRILPSDIPAFTHCEITARLSGQEHPTLDEVSWRMSGYDYEREGESYAFTPTSATEETTREHPEELVLTGTPASSGRAVGRARIVENADEAETVRQGEVLVTSMTTPDMMVGIERAGAIVTNEGGLLCHAAIVSRELGIPCVIGTGDATERLWNHGVIDVSGDQGRVELVKWQSQVRRPSHLLWKWLSLRGHAPDYFHQGSGIPSGYSAIKSVDHTTYASAKDGLEVKSLLSEGIGRDPGFILEVGAACRRNGEELVRVSESIAQYTPDELAALSNEQLIAEFERYLSAFLPTVPFRGIVLALGKMLDGLLAGWLKETLEDTLTSVEDAIGLLCLPSEDNVYQKELASLLKIGSRFRQAMAQMPSELRTSDGSATRAMEKCPVLADDLRSHADLFGWIATARDSRKPWSQDDLIARLVEVGWDQCDARLAEMEERRIARKKERDDLLSRMGVDDQHKLARAAAEIAYLRQDRMDLAFAAEYNVRPMYSEICRRLGIPYDDMVYLSPLEIRSWLLSGNSVSDGEIRDRKRDFALLLCVDRVEILSGDRTDWLRDGKVDYSQIREVSGTTANAGEAQGRAALLIDRRDIDKVQVGDVIISSMTTPEMMQAIERCSAIVTDEGGLLCHAAIVSRELGIPCVVGTEIATKIFRDGDAVWVEAGTESAKAGRQR